MGIDFQDVYVELDDAALESVYGGILDDNVGQVVTAAASVSAPALSVACVLISSVG